MTLDTTTTAQERIKKIINDQCIERVPKGSKELPSIDGNSFYEWQFYLRTALLNPFCLKTIADHFWSKFAESFEKCPFQLAGVECASVPLITAILLRGAELGVNVSAFTIRKNAKTYGRKNIIDGSPSNLPVFYVDDLTSPHHTTFWYAVNVLAINGFHLSTNGYVVVWKQLNKSNTVINTSIGTVQFHNLFTLEDFTLSYEEYVTKNFSSTETIVI